MCEYFSLICWFTNIYKLEELLVIKKYQTSFYKIK